MGLVYLDYLLGFAGIDILLVEHLAEVLLVFGGGFD